MTINEVNQTRAMLGARVSIKYNNIICNVLSCRRQGAGFKV